MTTVTKTDRFVRTIAEQERDYFEQSERLSDAELVSLVSGRSVSSIERNLGRHSCYNNDPYRDTYSMYCGY